MVNLSLDPPPFGRSSGGRSSRGLGRLLVAVLVLVGAFGGGFALGRKTAPNPLPFPFGGTSRQAAAPATQEKAAPPAAPGPQGGQAAQAPAAGSPSASAPAAVAAAPAAPQGPLLRQLSVKLRGSLEESIASGLAPGDRAWAQQLTQVVNRVLVWSMQVARDGRKGDSVEMLYELPSAQPSEVQAVGDGGPASKEPTLLALRYGSQKLGRVITAYRFKPQGAPFAHYYTAAGVEVEDHLVDGPIEGYEQVTSLLRDGRKHKGVDFKTPVGTAVKAPFDGQIGRRNWHFSSNGNCVELLDSRTGRRAIFLHLESVPKDMQAGRKVAKGEVIARSGNSGHSTAPHLHYQLEAPDGRILDPYSVHVTTKVSLDGAAKTAFEVERARLDPLLVAGR